MHAVPIVLKRIDMYATRPNMDLFALALVSHMDTIPANMDLFTLIGINNVDAARERNIDKWLIVAISALSRSLGFLGVVRIVRVGATARRVVGITSRLPI